MTPLLLLLGCSPEREICDNGLDDDGDQRIDCADPRCSNACDADADGFRAASLGGRDCDDTRAWVHPDAAEVCDVVDDDCDGLADDDDLDVDDATRVTVFVDVDGDAFGTDAIRRCAGTAGTAPRGGDCDDTSPDVHPLVPETCNGRDDDCDGLVDQADPVRSAPTLFRDQDADGFGEASEAEARCPEPGWSAVPGDCDDSRATVAPGAAEACDGFDSDCDGVLPADEIDGDGDGDPVCSDCDDADPSRASTSTEVCGALPVDEDCDGLVDDQDPSLDLFSCGWCPPDDLVLLQAAPLHEETWNPCLLDPNAVALCNVNPENPNTHSSGQRLHRVSWREDLGFWRDELFLFLPPGPGTDNETLRDWAAYAGYRVVSLGWVNHQQLLDVCTGSSPGPCYAESLYETTYGVDTSAAIDLGAADALVPRLTVLLNHLVAEHPEQGFDRYVDVGGPKWDRIVVAGWSEGGAQAAFLAHYEALGGALLLSAPKDHDPELLTPMDWITAPMVTPGCAITTSWHVEEPFCGPPVAILTRAWDAMGVGPLTFDLDQQTGTPPTDTRRLAQSLPESELPEGCDAHASVGRDDCMRPDVQFGPYLWLLCATGDLDPTTCEAPY